MSRWHVAAGTFAYLLSSCVVLLLFYPATAASLTLPALDEPSIFHWSAWPNYVLLRAGFLSLVYLALLSLLFSRWRSLRWADLTRASAASGIAGALLFIIGLRAAQVSVGPVTLIASIVFAMAIVAASAFVMLDGFMRLRSEGGITKSRRTALLLSTAFLVSCSVAFAGIQLLPWPELHFVELGNIGLEDPAPGVTMSMIIRHRLMTLITRYSIVIIVLWLLHLMVLALCFSRWRGLAQRAFAVGSLASGLLGAVLLSALNFVGAHSESPQFADISVAWILLLALTLLAALIAVATFLAFEVVARRKVLRVPTAA